MTIRIRLASLTAFVTAGCLLSSLALSGLAAAGSSVSVKDDTFAPTTLTVKKGTRVSFVWKGKHPHDVHATGASTFKTKVQTSGTFKYTFKKKGTVKLVCDVHPGMKATVKVE
ncbi:MAG: hypothetical protein JWM31_2218 [Solirubrobacterales bacterium]|nr:hypothetical protein [Solirubrobacterales bacterium]